jgi:predicted HTH domain antitoxin
MGVTFPDEVLKQTHLTNDELNVEMAVHLFEIEKLSFWQAAEMAGMSHWKFQQLLASRQIPLHYGMEELEQDLDTLRKQGLL